MLSIMLTALCLAGILTALAEGRAAEASAALLSGGGEAIRLLLSLAPALCLWSGMLELFERLGAAGKAAASGAGAAVPRVRPGRGGHGGAVRGSGLFSLLGLALPPALGVVKAFKK